MSETIVSVSEQTLSPVTYGVDRGIVAVVIKVTSGAPEDLYKKLNLVETYADFNEKYGNYVDSTDTSIIYARYLLRNGCVLLVGAVVYVEGSALDYTSVVGYLGDREVNFSLLLDLTDFDASAVAARYASVFTDRQSDFNLVLCAEDYATAHTAQASLKSLTYASNLELVLPSAIMQTAMFAKKSDGISGFTADLCIVPMAIPYTVNLVRLFQRGLFWKANAGYNNGVMPGVVDVAEKYSVTKVHEIQREGMNPVVNKISIGPVCWWDATLAGFDGQTADVIKDAHIRHLVNHLKQFVYTISQQFLFMDHTPETWALWINSVEPEIRGIAEAGGIVQYRVIMDRSIMSDVDIANGILRGQIMIQPTQTIKQIFISFSIDETGVTFE